MNLPSWPERPRAAHKGTTGRVVIVAGSPGMSGAAVLAARGALRAGAGLVTVACPESLLATVDGAVTCALTRPLPERDGRLGPWSRDALVAACEGADAIAVGPGLGANRATAHLLRAWLPTLRAPLVLDADGLNAFAGRRDRLTALAAPVVLTPHPGEAARLLASSSGAIQADRPAAARALAQDLPGAALLKGAGTLVSDGVRLFENATGNSGMASGGMGDVLTGVIATLLAQGLAPFEAACLGALVHGRAGDIAASRTGRHALLATDLLGALGEAIRAAGETPSGDHRAERETPDGEEQR